jgi:glycosyltransferase involved in cell wall biosynthesis
MGALLARHTRAIARNADGHIVSCTDDAEFLRGELGVERNRIAVIPQAAPDAFAQREALPITAARLRRVLHVSQFAFFKAPMIVAAAIDQLAAADDTLRFTWVCSRRHHDDVRRLLHTDRVELRDWMPAAQLIDVYDEHGIFLFASFFEGFGKVFLEAMSRGLCVVAARTGGAPDIIVDRANGRLVEPGDAGALASATQALVHDLPEATVMGTAAARTARAYTWERVARETADFYERLRAMRR